MNVMKQNNYSINKPCFTIYNDVFSYEECDNISEKQIDKDIIRDNNDSINSNFLNPNYRYSYDKCILEDSEELEKKLISFIFDCNSKVYGYDIWGFEEDIKLLTFQKDDYIKEHERILWYSEEPNDRKLTGYLFLSHPKSYNGGKFKTDEISGIADISTHYNRKGNLLIYPSFVSLSIDYIKSGFMQVLTFDIIGPNLR